jgi:predicted enzyme related to lactoylglutathione lyase
MKKNPVVHFEMPADDVKRMADFYSGVFGWEPQFLGEQMGNYVTVSTHDTENFGPSAQRGAIDGGLFPKQEGMQNLHPSIVIAVEDINEHIDKISGAGGQVIGQPVDIPGVGRYVSFKDTEGNICSILQPVMPEMERVSQQDFGETGEI